MQSVLTMFAMLLMSSIATAQIHPFIQEQVELPDSITTTGFEDISFDGSRLFLQSQENKILVFDVQHPTQAFKFTDLNDDKLWGVLDVRNGLVLARVNSSCVAIYEIKPDLSLVQNEKMECLPGDYVQKGLLTDNRAYASTSTHMNELSLDGQKLDLIQSLKIPDMNHTFFMWNEQVREVTLVSEPHMSSPVQDTLLQVYNAPKDGLMSLAYVQPVDKNLRLEKKGDQILVEMVTAEKEILIEKLSFSKDEVSLKEVFRIPQEMNPFLSFWHFEMSENLFIGSFWKAIDNAYVGFSTTGPAPKVWDQEIFFHYERPRWMRINGKSLQILRISQKSTPKWVLETYSW